MERLKNKSVLIVDDDERNCYALSSYLELLEMRVLTAGDGNAAMSVLKSGETIDLILLDITMPVMDGYQMLHLLKSDVALKNIPVIAVTANAMKGDAIKCLDAGAMDYISKPINLKNIVSKMTKWL